MVHHRRIGEAKAAAFGNAGDGMGIDGKTRGNGKAAGNTAILAGGRRYPVAPGDKMIAFVRRRCDCFAILAVVQGLHRCANDVTVFTRRVL
ncbi:MAG: hypothetical protein BWY09_01759 [Candidatus Hydrogenedentes bacterium ADurb.Bin179]|nr:MAG: hypothetical protein BWY09_01759 [Candidatus Hydrogenedentes bacterium ADurb.Bin179]